VAELRAWITDTGRAGTDTVFDLPGAPQVSKVMRKDLKFAGVPYVDDRGRYFDHLLTQALPCNPRRQRPLLRPGFFFGLALGRRRNRATMETVLDTPTQEAAWTTSS
jgi:hypothetical protein